MKPGQRSRKCSRFISRTTYNVEVIVYIHNTTDFHRGELVLAAEMEDETGQTFQLHEVMTKDGSVVRQFLEYQYEN